MLLVPTLQLALLEAVECPLWYMLLCRSHTMPHHSQCPTVVCAWPAGLQVHRHPLGECAVLHAQDLCCMLGYGSKMSMHVR